MNDAVADLERLVQTLELRDVVPFELIARFGAQVERRGENSTFSTSFRRFVTYFGLQLEGELPDAPAVRPRLTWIDRSVFPDADARDEAEAGSKPFANLLEVQGDVPPIVRVVELESAGAVARLRVAPSSVARR